MLDKHIGRGGVRITQRNKREVVGGTGDIWESFLDPTQTTGSDGICDVSAGFSKDGGIGGGAGNRGRLEKTPWGRQG